MGVKFARHSCLHASSFQLSMAMNCIGVKVLSEEFIMYNLDIMGIHSEDLKSPHILF